MGVTSRVPGDVRVIGMSDERDRLGGELRQMKAFRAQGSRRSCQSINVGYGLFHA